jgi:hypothetical protein
MKKNNLGLAVILSMIVITLWLFAFRFIIRFLTN